MSEASFAEWTGCLEGISPAELLWQIASRGQTGVLRITREPVTRDLYFQDGRVVFVTSTDPDDRLGERLLRQRKISLEQLESALTRLRTGKRLGTLLVENGALTAEDLVTAVVCQVRSIVLAVLGWERGSYVFKEGPLPTHEVITLQTPMPALLLHALRNRRSVGRVLRRAGPPHTVYILRERRAHMLAELGATEGERRLLERLEAGPASIETLCREVMLSGWEIYSALDALALLGIVERTDAHEPRAEAAMREGRMSQHPLPDLLVQLHREGVTGVLHLHRDGVERRLHVERGRCSFAASSDADDGLLHALFRSGMISLADKEEAQRRLRSDRRVGLVLRDLGVLDDDDLRQCVRRQVGEMILDCFTWSDGDWCFVPGMAAEHEDIELGLGPRELIFEGVRRIECWTRLVRGCGGIDNPQRLTAGHAALVEPFPPGSEERRIVTALSSTSTARRLCALSDVDDFRVCQILWTLRLLGAVEDAPIEIEEEEEVGAAGAPALDAEAQPLQLLTPSPGAAEQVQAALRELPEQVHATRADDWNTPANAVEQVAAAEHWGTPPVASAPAPAPAPALAAVDPSPLPVEARAAVPTEQPEPVAAVASAPEWPGPPDLEQVILRFNEMHRVVFRAVRGEVGAGAINFVRSCCMRTGRSCEDVLHDVELHADGSWDPEGLKRVVCQRHIEDPWPRYQRILDQLYVDLTPHLGPTRAEALKQRILQLAASAPGPAAAAPESVVAGGTPVDHSSR